MSDRLILRTVTSPFLIPYNDNTKGNVLSHTELDNNFLYLKGNVIYTAETSGSFVTLKKLNGEDFTFEVGSGGGGGAGGDFYWTSGSTGTKSIKVNNGTGLDATGNYSVAEGYDTTAGGDYSHAEGYNAHALNSASHAEGTFTIASGVASHAEGEFTTASGDYSHAEGSETTAQGDYSHAEGSETTAQGDYSHAEGIVTKAIGNYSHAEGYGSQAKGNSSHAEGEYTIASGTTSHSEGSDTQALGTDSHSEGAKTIAIGRQSHAEGKGTTANGFASHSEGEGTKAIGNYSHAEGYFTTASGITSHAEGNNTIASGEGSHAGGYGTSGYVVASGNTSFVHQYVSGSGQFGAGNYGSYGSYSAILGGQDHYIQSGSESGSIVGGNSHLLYGASVNSGIFGGNANLLIDTYYGVVLGGDANGTIQADSSAIVGGYNNVIDTFNFNLPTYSFIGAGSNNKIENNSGSGDAVGDVIMGGDSNLIDGNNSFNGIYNSSNSYLTSQSTSVIINSEGSHIEDGGGFGSSNNTIIGTYNSTIEANGVTYASIFGGANNNIFQENSLAGIIPNYSVIIGGDANRIDNSDTATILNGFTNTIDTNSKQSSILNGQYHTIISSKFSSIIGGNSNEMTDSNGSTIIGGSDNGILSDGNPAFTRYYNAILGGTGNTISNSELSFIMGGYQNVIPYGKVGVVILGGDSITGSSNNTVYVQKLNIKTVTNDNTTIRFLTLDANNNVAFRNLSSISGGTGGGTGGDSYWVSGTTGTYSLKALNDSGLDAVANYSFAVNNATMADGINSFAAGHSTWARGLTSTSIGENTEAFGDYTFAGGHNTKASGTTSFIWSTESTAFGNRSAVLGGTGIAGSNDDTVYVPYLNIQSATTDNTLTQFLVKSTDGTIKTRTLPTDVRVTGGTYTDGNATFTNNTGGTFTVTGFKTSDTFVTGGTYNNSTGTAIFTNNSGSTFNVTGFSTGSTSVTGFTYSNNNLTVKQSSGDLTVNINTMTGLTINGNLTFTGQTNNPVYTAGTLTSSFIPNWDNSNLQHVILSAATTSISGGTNIKNGAVYTMIVKQNATGSRLITWAPQYKWQSGIAPILSSTSNSVDIFTFISDGTNLYGLIAKDFR
jgi:hypothetical protein